MGSRRRQNRHLYPALRAISNKNTNLECQTGHDEEAECDMPLNASDGMIFRNSHFCKAERNLSPRRHGVTEKPESGNGGQLLRCRNLYRCSESKKARRMKANLPLSCLGFYS